MQFVKATKASILKPLQAVSGIVERKQSYPILANVLISKQDTDVKFVATDLEIQIVAHAEVGTPGEDTAITVGSRKLFDIVRSLPDDLDVGLTSNDRKVTISSGKSTRFSLQTLPVEDFPIMKEITDFQFSFSLPQKTLKNLFELVCFAIAQQDVRYYLQGMLIQTQNGIIKGVATDSHRMTYAHATFNENSTNEDFIVPRKTVLELARILDETDDPVTVKVSANQIMFVFGNIEFISKRIEGKFPDYQRVIPSGYANKFQVNREKLQVALQRAAIMTNDKFKSIRCLLRHNSLTIRSTNTDNEEATEELEINYQGADLDVGFNVTYLLDVLGVLKTEEVTFELEDERSSVLISTPDDLAFKYVLMPMRI